MSARIYAFGVPPAIVGSRLKYNESQDDNDDDDRNGEDEQDDIDYSRRGRLQTTLTARDDRLSSSALGRLGGRLVGHLLVGRGSTAIEFSVHASTQEPGGECTSQLRTPTRALHEENDWSPPHASVGCSLIYVDPLNE